ncbi:uncharacterized protein PITG_01757 [Phytophthora infestans T30-4]|uniref:Uncharacterized protein n=1 Tax=Phytophthora infestans (strain T30-4) TaxID=403677 RepID=D0MU09_PHYIT|nr:uncharacterized protein PITG_01757 [Phytophthora infestans T30-4]EEY61456.1 conserved hypothetical protein [Phytophthora infestans T30-4]|eukprot:XP_002908373.1 conserved hypothetical protein [Phytophthora infestans T30-4]
MPIFRDSSYLNAMASTRAQGEVVDEKKEKPARSKAKRKMRSKAQTPSKRRLTTPAQAQPYSGFYEHKEQDRADLARVLDCILNYHPSKREVAQIQVNHVKKQSQAVLESEDKRRVEMLKCDVDVKRGRGEVQLLLERMLARQTMRKDGISNDDIEVVLPLKEP